MIVWSSPGWAVCGTMFQSNWGCFSCVYIAWEGFIFFLLYVHVYAQKLVFLDEYHKNNISRKLWTFPNLTFLCSKAQNFSELSWVGTRCFRSEKGTAAKQQLSSPITQNSWKCQPNVYCTFHHMTPFLLHNISKDNNEIPEQCKVSWFNYERLCQYFSSLKCV